MPNQKAVELSVGNGATVTIWYNDANNRIGNVEYFLPAGNVALVQIWDTGVPLWEDPGVTFAAGTGAESVPGNYRMVEVTEGDETFLDLPPELTYTLKIRSL